MRRPQRAAALRIIRAYIMVSDEAAFLLADMPPVDLLAEKKARIKARLAEAPPPDASTEDGRTKRPGQSRGPPHDTGPNEERLFPVVPSSHGGRASNSRCMHCPGSSNTAEHTLFHCANREGCRTELRNRLGHPPDMPDIVCGLIFEGLPVNHQKKVVILRNTEETFRFFYKMIEDILMLKEIEEKARQAADAADNG